MKDSKDPSQLPMPLPRREDCGATNCHNCGREGPCVVKPRSVPETEETE